MAFQATNTIYRHLSQKPKKTNLSGINKLKCGTCNKVYIGQSRRSISIRHKEHTCYIRNYSPTFAYAMHILRNRHEFGPAERTLQLLKHCYKETRMNIWESLFIHTHHKHGLLISKQQVADPNPLFNLARIPHDSCSIP
jgi:hypothetical protein